MKKILMMLVVLSSACAPSIEAENKENSKIENGLIVFEGEKEVDEIVKLSGQKGTLTAAFYSDSGRCDMWIKRGQNENVEVTRHDLFPTETKLTMLIPEDAEEVVVHMYCNKALTKERDENGNVFKIADIRIEVGFEASF